MWKAIDLEKLDELLNEFRNFGHEGETFSSFVEKTKDDEIPVWNWVDSVGVLTYADLERDFSKSFVSEHFYDLANAWFNGLSEQVDFGIVEQCVKDEFQDAEIPEPIEAERREEFCN